MSVTYFDQLLLADHKRHVVYVSLVGTMIPASALQTDPIKASHTIPMLVN